MLKVGFDRHFQTVIGVFLFALFPAATSIAQSVNVSTTAGAFNTHYTSGITTSGFGSIPQISLSSTDAAWLSITDHGDGTATLEGDPAGAGNYNVEITATDGTDTRVEPFILSIAKVTPDVLWAAPSAIVYGTALSGAHLNATCAIAGTFLYSPSAGTILSAGTHTLSVSFTPSDAANYNTSGNSVNITVNKATPSISWGAPLAITYGTALSATQLNATAGGSLPGTFTYTPAAGAILNAGTRTLSVDFTPSDATNYNPVIGTTVSIIVTKATPVISWTPPSAITYGTALGVTQLSASTTPSGTFTYTPASGAILNAGTRTLSVDFAPSDPANYNVVNGTSVSIVVNKATPTITWNSPTAITYGTALSATQLNATSSAGGTFTYTPVIGTVMNSGVRTLLVDFTPADAANYNPVTGTQTTLIINKATPTVSWNTPTAIAYGTALSSTQLNASSGTAGSFIYYPTAGAILNAGTQPLMADFIPTDGLNYNTISGATVNLVVNKANPVITWTNPAAITYGTTLNTTQLNASANVGGTFAYTPGVGTLLTAGAQTLAAEFTPTDAVNYNVISNIQRPLTVNKATPLISWSNPAAITYGTALTATELNASASVAGAFVYTPAAGATPNAGSRTLSVNFTPSDAANYLSVNGTTVTIMVNKATPDITWANPLAITYGTALSATQLSATASVGGSFVYSPAAGSVLNAGTQTLSANFTPSDAANYNSVLNVQRSLTVSKATPVITWNAPVPITYGTALSASQLNASANVTGSFVYTPSGGTVLNAGTQTLLADFTPADATNYNPVIGATTSITVNKANPVITWSNPAAISYGTALSATQLNATASVAGTFAYTPAAGAILNAGAGQTLSVSFTPTDGTNYNIANANRTITVIKATPTVTWNNPAAIVYGTPLSATQQNASASVAGTFQYVPGPGTILPTGSNQAIAVNFTPTDGANYNAVNGTQVLISVNKATPVITWNNPADIVYGTPLSATQLNATSTVAGTFNYSPGSGTVLSAGAGQALTATFTPTDFNNYNAVTGLNVSINVLKANPTITWATPVAITYGTALSGAQLNASANVPGTFTYNPASGTVLNAGPNQVLSATFVPTDAANYNTIANTTRQITVNKANPLVTWSNPASIVYGTPLSPTQQNATASVPGVFDYTPAAGTVLSVGAGQNISVKFTPTDLANYNVVTTTTVQITVTKATPVITWNPSPVKVFTALNTTQHLNAVSTVPGTFTYNPAAGHFYIVNGTYTLTADFVPNDPANYNSVSNIQVPIVVSNKDNPVITWSNQAPITYGTLLSTDQQTATADVGGTFSYSPGANTLLNAGANQNLTVTFTPDDGANYNIVSKTVQITVNKKTLTATAANASRAYGANNPTFVINYTGFVNGETSTVIDTRPTATSSAIVSDPAGSTFAIEPAGGTDNNYQFTYVNGTLTINKATLTAKADNNTRPYGTANLPVTITYTGFANGDDEGDITPPDSETDASPASNVGNYTISLKNGAALNYTLVLQTGVCAVTKAPLVATPDPSTKVYGTPNPNFVIKYLGFQNGETATNLPPLDFTAPGISPAAGTLSPVGSYAVNLTGGSAKNYTFLLFPGTLTVTKATLTAKANDKNRPYGGVNPGYDIGYTGFVGADGAASITQPAITGPNVNSSSAAGAYTIQLSGGSAVNYDLILQNGTLTITKVTLTAKAANKSKFYGDVDPPLTVTYTGFVNGENELAITQSTASLTGTPVNVGSYTIGVSGGSATNYNFTYQTGTYTINPASLIAKAIDKSRSYGDANPPLTISYTGFQLGDDASKITEPKTTTVANTMSNVGNYAITFMTPGTATNYTITLQQGNLSVVKAPLTAKADDLTKQYGALVPSPSITYTGFVNGETATSIPPANFTPPTIATTATTTSSAGTYPITLTGGSGSNYTFILLLNGTLTVTKAPLTATVGNKTRVYGAANPVPYTITYSGFVAGDDKTRITEPTASTTATATSNVGPYDITLAGTTTNYDFTFVPGVLTVTKAPLTIAAASKTKVYGAANPALTVNYTGFVNGETSAVLDSQPVISSTTSETTPFKATPYTGAITVAVGIDNNYNITTTPADMTVTKAPLTAKADNKSKLFGAANPALTITYTGFVNGETSTSIPSVNFTAPAIATTATVSSPFGSYPITLSGGTATNYTLSLQPGTMTVAAAQIIVTAKDKTKVYGAANPAFELTYSGFVGGQTAADLDVLPVASTIATNASATGEYAITVTGGADTNYTFAYVPGKLTVTKASLTATADSKSTTYGTIPAYTVSYSGFVNGDNASMIDLPPTTSATASVTSGPGTYPITLTGGLDDNYTIANANGTLTINKATLTAKADDQSRIIGLPDPAFTITYTGFMNSETASVIDSRPTATTTATTSSTAGPYPITVSGGSDDHYTFAYQTGTLTVILDNPPVVKNFQLEMEEDKSIDITLSLFAANYTDEPNGKIAYIKIVSLPQNGSLFHGDTRVLAGDNISVVSNSIGDLKYVPNSNYSGSDSFGWNLFDGTFLALNSATVTIKVKPVNDPPALSNIESTTLQYSPGDAPILITRGVIINDVDDNFVWSASVQITGTLSSGDQLSVEGGITGTEVKASYDPAGGELKLTGKHTRAAYQELLTKVTFSSPVNTPVSEKRITMLVRDSVANSNIVTRDVEITEVFPELSIVNAFTPNGDRANDFWDILNLGNYTDIKVFVYSQEGIKVYECFSTDCKWDGTNKGKPLPAGPYLYTIDVNQGKRTYKGVVTILK